jgi:membrane associated rhomboid family serine protease
MGIYDRPYYQDEPRAGFSFSGRSMIVNLIIVNVAVYLVDAFLFEMLNLANSPFRPTRLFAVHSDTLMKPWMWWQFLTYGFCHDPAKIGHILGNMLGLFFLGQEVERQYGAKTFLRMYLTTLVLCSVVWGVTETLFIQRPEGSTATLIGASGAVTAVVMLFAFNFPRRTILFMMFIPMPAWVLGVMIVVFNLFGANAAGPENRIAFDVHLTGAAYGYLFFRTRWAFGSLPFFGDGTGGGSSTGSGKRSPGGGGFFGKLRWPGSRPKLKVHQPEERMTVLDEQADAVLDKLHREGIQNLSPRERRILEEYSRRMQQKHR